MRHWLKILGGTIVAIGAINFIAFAIIASHLGGDALNGKVEYGHYYLMEHGRYTEVSRNVWIYSRIHAISAIALHPGPLVLAGAVMAFLGKMVRQKRSG
jgi:hypothetical protein